MLHNDGLPTGCFSLKKTLLAEQQPARLLLLILYFTQ
jgi:hypothetical protein